MYTCDSMAAPPESRLALFLRINRGEHRMTDDEDIGMRRGEVGLRTTNKGLLSSS